MSNPYKKLEQVELILNKIAKEKQLLKTQMKWDKKPIGYLKSKEFKVIYSNTDAYHHGSHYDNVIIDGNIVVSSDNNGKRFYNDEKGLNIPNCGKGELFFNGSDENEVDNTILLCMRLGLCSLIKRSDYGVSRDRGVVHFYVDATDIGTHRKLIQFFIDHGLLCKIGKIPLDDISFKLDGLVSDLEVNVNGNFDPTLSLSDFMDLNTTEGKI